MADWISAIEWKLGGLLLSSKAISIVVVRGVVSFAIGLSIIDIAARGPPLAIGVGNIG